MGGDVQRCDAKHPCTPCSKDAESDCVYESRVIRRTHKKPPAAAHPPLHSFKVKPSLCGSLSLSSNGSSLSAPYTPSFDISGSVLSLMYSNSSHVSPKESHFPGSGALDRFEPPAPQGTSVSEMKLVPFRKESPKAHQPVTMPAFSLLPSLQLPSAIPRPPHTPLSLLDPERLQISDATSSELDFKLCVFPFPGVIPRRRGS